MLKPYSFGIFPALQSLCKPKEEFTMSASKITIRPATPDDAEALLSIYAPYVEQTANHL